MNSSGMSYEDVVDGLISGSQFDNISKSLLFVEAEIPEIEKKSRSTKKKPEESK